MVKRIGVVPDIQAPYESQTAFQAVLRWIQQADLDHLIQIGDLADYPQPSSWSKGTAAEFEGSVFRDSEYIKSNILAPIRDVYDGPFGIFEGNHDERPRVYLAKYAPALAESGAFKFDVLCDFDGFGIDVMPTFWEFAPGWVMTHGHKGGIKMVPNAGATALNGAKKFLKSVIMGHTHRMGSIPATFGYDGKITATLEGVEVGHLMDMKKAQYLKGATANWQQGFAVVDIDDEENVSVQTVPITDDGFVVDGEFFSLSS